MIVLDSFLSILKFVYSLMMIFIAANNGISDSAPHWLKSIHQLTEVESSPFMQHFPPRNSCKLLLVLSEWCLYIPKSRGEKAFFFYKDFLLVCLTPFNFFVCLCFLWTKILESVKFSCFLEVVINQTPFIYNFIRE